MKSMTAGAGSWVRGLAALALALVGAANAGCGEKCDNRCASALSVTVVEAKPERPSSLEVGFWTPTQPRGEDDTDFLVAKVGAKVQWCGRGKIEQEKSTVCSLVHEVKKSTRVADGRLRVELFDDRVKKAVPAEFGTVYFNVTLDPPTRITAEQFEALGGNKPQPLFKNAAEFATVGRYLACAGLTMSVSVSEGTTRVTAELRNTSDLAQFIDTALLDEKDGALTIAAYGDDKLKFPRFGGQCHYAAFFSISSLMNFNSNSIGLT